MNNTLILPTYDQIRAERCRRSLYEFCREFWPVIEPGRQFKDNWHIKAICDHLEAVTRRDIKRLIINVPPRHMKSLLCSVFWVAWSWIDNPSHRWMTTSYAQNLSTRDALKTRRLITSDKYLKWYGDSFVLTGDQNTKQRYENDKTGYRIAASVGGQLTGDGGDTILVDDAHNVGEADSTLKRESTIDWYDHSLSTRLNDPETGAIVVIMQRVHEQDLIGHILEKEPDVWDRLILPARYEAEHPTPCQTTLAFSDPRIEEGALLWPDRISLEVLDKLEKTLGPRATAGQLQQRPSPKEGGMIKREWFQWYDTLPENCDKFVQSWDLAFKDTKTSDFVAGVYAAKHEGNIYIEDGINSRLDCPGSVDAIQAMKTTHPKTSAIYIEDKANGPAVIQLLRNKLAGLIAINPGQDSKESRAAAASAYIRSGNVFLKRNHPISDMIVEQCAGFPFGANDDLVDALMQLLKEEFGGANLSDLYKALMK